MASNNLEIIELAQKAQQKSTEVAKAPVPQKDPVKALADQAHVQRMILDVPEMVNKYFKDYGAFYDNARSRLGTFNYTTGYDIYRDVNAEVNGFVDRSTALRRILANYKEYFSPEWYNEVMTGLDTVGADNETIRQWYMDEQNFIRQFDDEASYNYYVQNYRPIERMTDEELEQKIQEEEAALFEWSKTETAKMIPGDEGQQQTFLKEYAKREENLNRYKNERTNRHDSRISQADMDEFAKWSTDEQNMLREWASTNPDKAGWDNVLPADQRRISGNYNTLVAKYGEDAVKRITETVSREQGAKINQAAEASGSKGGFGNWMLARGANLLAAFATPFGILDNAKTDTGRYISANPNNVGGTLNVYAGAVDDTIANRWKAHGGAVGYYGYQAITGAVDNTLRTLLTGSVVGQGSKFFEAASLGLAGMQGFSSAYNQYARSGMRNSDAIALAVIEGGTEILTEKLPFDNLMNIVGGNAKTRTQIVMDILKQAGAEVLEEEAGLIIGAIAEWNILKERSEWRQRYEEYRRSGMSEDEAQKRTFKDFLHEMADTAIVSAGSGGISGTGGALVNRYVYGNKPITKAQSQEVKGIAQKFVQNGMDRTEAQETAGQLWEASQPYGEQAKAVQAAYVPGQDVQQFARGFALAYSYGESGANQEALSEEKAVQYISESQRDIAYTMGAEAKAKADRQMKKNELGKLESSYDVGEDGKTYQLDTDDEIEIKGFASLGGKPMLDIGKGKKVAADNVKYASTEEAVLYETIGKVAGSVSNANTMLKMFRDQNTMSASDYAAGLEEAYEAGRIGTMTERQLRDSEFASQLPVGVASVAYNRGVARGKGMAQVKQGILNAAAKGEAKPGKLHFDAEGKNLNQKQKTALRVMDTLAQTFGLQIHVFESYEKNGSRVYKNANGEEVKAPNGWYDPSDGSIHIDLNAGNAGEGTMMFTIAHELTHFIKQWSPVKYRVLADILVKKYAEHGQSVAELIQNQKDKAERNGRKLTTEEAFDEVVADSLETMLLQKDTAQFMAEVQQRDKSLWQKLKAWFKDLADKLSKAIEAYGDVDASTPEGRMVAQMGDAIRELQKAYAEALVDAGATYKTSGANIEKNGEIVYSKRYFKENVFPPYNESKSDSHEVAERWSRSPYTKSGEKRLLSHHGRWYVIQAFDDMKYGYQIVDHLTKKQYLKGASYYEAVSGHESLQNEISKGVTRDNRSGASGNAGNRIDHDATEHGRENRRVHRMGSEQNGRQSTERNGSGDLQSGNLDRNRENGSAIEQLEEKKHFSLREPVERTKNLIALHNLTESKLEKSLNLGGFPMPSIAVTKSDIPHTNFGEITLVFGRETIDPKANRKNVVYSADAWTPVFPRVEYEESAKETSRIYNHLRGLEKKIASQFQRNLRMAYQDIEGGLNRYDGEDGYINHLLDNYGLKAAYLEETGKHIDDVYVQKEKDLGYNRASADRYEKVANILGVKTPEEIRSFNLKTAREEYGDELEKVYPGITKTAFRMANIFRAVSEYLGNKDASATYESVIDESATRKRIDETIDREAFEKWVRNLYSGIVANTGVYNNKPLFTDIGNRRTFKQTHLPVTLENIVKAMASQNNGSTKNVSGFNGIKTLRAGTAERFKSVDAMHASEGRLQNLSPEEFDEVTNNLQSRLYEIIKEIDAENGEQGNSNSFIRFDTIGNVITEISESGKFNVSDIQNVFSGYGRTVSDDVALRLKQLLFDVTLMPVNMFEAKPERVVGINEIKAAIIPEGTSDSVISKLKSNGVQVKFYKSGDNDERLKLVNSVDNVLFSDRDPTAAATQAEIEKQNEKLREDVANLRALLKLQGGAKQFTNRNIESAAKFLIQQTGVTDSEKHPAPLSEITKLLSDFYNTVNTSADLSWDDVQKSTRPVVDWLIQHNPKSRNYSEYTREALSEARSMKINLTDEERTKAAEGFENYEAFRKSAMGSLVFANDGISIDSAVDTLAKLYPDAFADVVNADNKPHALLEAVKNLRSANIEYAYIRDIERQDIARSVYDSYWRVNNLSKSNSAEAAAINKKHRDSMNVIHREQKEASEKIRKSVAKGHQKILAESRTEAMAAVAKVKANYEKRIAKAAESKDLQKYRTRVEAQVKKLMKMLTNPTKDAHVPSALQEPLGKLLDSIDYRSVRQLKNGEEGATIKDVAYTRALEAMRKSLNDQRAALEKGEGAYSLDLPAEFLEKIDAHINAIIYATEKLELSNNRLYKMTAEQTKDLLYILNTINQAISNIDKLHMAGAKARISELGKSTMWEMGKRKPTKSDSGNKMMWRNYTPVFAFERMGAAAKQIFDGLTQGQAKLAKTTAAIIKFAKETYTGKEVKQWEREVHTIKLESGKEIKMTTAQIMGFYCLSKREHAKQHMAGGGVRISTFKQGAKETVQKENFNLTEKDIGNINSLLTDRQLTVAKALQSYMQKVGGKLINEISMARWDYAAATEENYYPIKTLEENRDARNPGEEQTSLWSLLNKSFTKGLTENARGAIQVDSIFDVFASHMSETAEYNAFALPLVDAMKWFNYREVIDMDNGQIQEKGVRRSLKDTLGTEATKYFIDLMTDINSAQKAGRNEGIISEFLSRSKAASVGWNLRVAIQQPTAILRAGVYLSPADMAKGSAQLNTKKLAEEMYANSGIALWKSLGYYDLNVSRSVQDQIKGDDSIIDKVNDAGMWLPGKMDEITWARIWAACKEKVSREQKLTGEALLKETGKLFDNLVYHSQVADSVLTRSSVMRDKSLKIKEMTSFMAEPTMAINLLMSAFQDYRDNATSKDKAMRAMRIGFYGYVLPSIINALVTSLWDAVRDDDEYEEFWEKYLQALMGEKFWDGNLFNELNPVSKLVAFRDIISMLQGYDVTNPYAEAIQSAIDMTNSLIKYFKGESNLTEYGLIYNGLKVLDGFTGMAAGNFVRDAVSIWNSTIGAREDMIIHKYEEKTKTKIGDAFKAGALTEREAIRELVKSGEAEDEDEAFFIVQKWRTKDGKYDALYRAVLDGKGVDKAMDVLTEHGVDKKTIQSNLRSTIGKWYYDEESETRIERDDAYDMLIEYGGMKPKDAEAQLLKWDMKRDTGISYSEAKDAFQGGNLSEAEALSYLQTYGGLTEEEAQERVDEWKFEAKWGFGEGDIKATYQDGEITRDEAMKVLTEDKGMLKTAAEAKIRKWECKMETGIDYDDIEEEFVAGHITRQQAMEYRMKYGGVDQEDAEDETLKWQMEIDTGYKYTDLPDAVTSGEVSDETAIGWLVKYGGKKEEDAPKTVQAWKWRYQNPQYKSLGIEQIDSYLEFCEPAGVDIQYFYDIVKFSSKTENDINAAGKSVRYSAVRKVCAEINKLPISRAQKEAIAVAMGWSKSTISRCRLW